MGELREKSMSIQGKVILDHTIPRMEYQGLRINAGQIVRVIDIEGEQVMDTVTLNASDPSEHSSMPWSNFLNKTWRLKKGHIIYSIRCNPMFKIIEEITPGRSEEHTSELQSRQYLVCRLLLEKKKKNK